MTGDRDEIDAGHPDIMVRPDVAYSELCQSYCAIDEFRSKLLSFLPFVSGAGMLALLGPIASEDASKLLPVGILGGLVTIGLFVLELCGVRKCRESWKRRDDCRDVVEGAR